MSSCKKQVQTCREKSNEVLIIWTLLRPIFADADTFGMPHIHTPRAEPCLELRAIYFVHHHDKESLAERQCKCVAWTGFSQAPSQVGDGSIQERDTSAIIEPPNAMQACWSRCSQNSIA